MQFLNRSKNRDTFLLDAVIADYILLEGTGTLHNTDTMLKREGSGYSVGCNLQPKGPRWH